MNKYIVKNCPCFNKNPNNEYWVECGNQHVSALRCSNCTDCLIKQVIEKCKRYEDMSSCYDCIWGNGAANEILQLFEIEECEEWA